MRTLIPLQRPQGPWPFLGLIYIALAIGVQFIPLANEIHYEFAAIIALAASLATGLIVVGDRAQSDWPESRAQGAQRLTRAVGLASVLAIVPLAVALVATGLGESCGIAEGVAWYMLLVPPAAALSAVLGFAATVVCRRRWAATLLFLLLWGASMGRGAFEALTGPHIFMYAWQVGFFPGGSWDAELPIPPLLIAYRAAHLLVAGMLGLVLLELSEARRMAHARNHGHNTPAVASIGPAVVAASRQPHYTVRHGGRVALACAFAVAACGCALIAFRADLGLTRTVGWVRAQLGDSVGTRHAVIYYNAPTTDSLDLWRARTYSEFYITEHAAALGIPESEITPIAIYLYPSEAEQKRMVGTASAAFTKPWAAMVNMTFAGVGHTLRHELAHVMLARFGNPLGISLSQGLLEGSAMALENEYGERSLHEYARAMYAFKLAPPADRIMGVGGFAAQRTSVGYVLAGSFSRWLIQQYGMRRYLRAFAWADFHEAYGRDLHQLSDEYSRFIDSLPAPASPTAVIAARHLFGGGSFFLQRCLRRIGTLNARGYEALAEERYARAADAFGESLRDGINYGARAGMLRALWGMGTFDRLLDSAAAYNRDTASYPLVPYLIEQGDARWALGNLPAAARLYDSAFALDVNEGISFRAALRRYFLDAEPAVRAIMRAYFTRPSSVLGRLAVLDNAMAACTDARARAVLLMMRATWTARQMPATTMAMLGATAIPGPSQRGITETPARAALLARIRRGLAGRLVDAADFVAGTNAGMVPPVAESIRRIVASAESPTTAGRAFHAERAAERDRYTRFLREHGTEAIARSATSGH